MFIGVADPVVFANAVKQGKPVPYIPHSPNYIVDLKALPVGAKVTTVSMLELLTKSKLLIKRCIHMHLFLSFKS